MADLNPYPLIVILGQTGTGKSALAIELAELFNGEIIAADSRTIYREMNIGTAKPTPDDRHRIQHHLLDVVSPKEHFTVYDFKARAEAAAAAITARGKIPFLVGGTGLYIDAVLYGFTFRPEASPEVRARLERLTVPELQQEVVSRGLPMPNNQHNPVHLRRLLESGPSPQQLRTLRPRTLILGMEIVRDQLVPRLHNRALGMLHEGLIPEVQLLLAAYGEAKTLRAPAYRAVKRYLDGDLPLTALANEMVSNDLYLAKRQRTWFRRNAHINWRSPQDGLASYVDLITTFLRACDVG